MQESRMRQELLANEPLFDHFCRLRDMIPRHSEDLYEYRVDWELLKKVD